MMSRALANFTAISTAICVIAGESFAAQAADAAGNGGAEKAGGLPQLDPTWFASQLFWLALMFMFLYAIFSRNVLPNLSATLESRREHIQRDLDTAQELKQEAENVFEDYELILNGSRDKATQLYQDIDTDIREKTTAEYLDFQERLGKETKMAEAKINAAKKDAMADMNSIVADVAREAAEKIVGISTDMDKAKSVVDGLANKAKAA